MKSIIISLFGLASLGFLSSCTTVESQPPSTYSRTTTTDVAPTFGSSVETRTTRSY